MKLLTVLLAILWLSLIFIMGVNMYNQFQVSQQSLKVIRLYKFKSECPKTFTSVIDSLNTEIAKTEARVGTMGKPFPIKDAAKNWIMLRLAVILLSIITGIILWFHYKKPHVT